METAAPSEVSTPPPSIEDLATHDFQQLIPIFQKKIEACTNRQLKRVVNALMEYPFSEHGVRLPYSQERELFNIGAKLFDCKFVIMKAVREMSKEEMDKVMAETKKEEETNV